MKKTVLVVIEKYIEVEIDDDKLTPAAMADFSSYMWDVDEADELFKYAARQHAMYGSEFIEGLGALKFKEKSSETEEEIVC